MLRILQNIPAMNTLRSMRRADESLNRSLSRLSSGLRVSKASDDAAGLSITESLMTQVRGAAQGTRNVEDGFSMINVAEGALSEVEAMLQRMQELATQSANGNYTGNDRQALQAELNALLAEISFISSKTDFNGILLFTGQAGGFTSSNFSTPAFSVPSNVGTTTFTLTGPATGASALNSVTINSQDNGIAGVPPVIGPPAVPGVPAVPPTPITLSQPADFTVTSVPAGIAGTTQLFTYSVTLNNSALGAVANNPPFTVSASANMTYPTVVNPLQVDIQYGANVGESQAVFIPQMNTSVIGVASVNVSSQTAAQSAIGSISAAITSVSAMRTSLGAHYNRLEHARANQAIMRQNQGAAYSQIRDTDMALESSQMAREQILSQSSIQMLSIANDRSYITRLLNS